MTTPEKSSRPDWKKGALSLLVFVGMGAIGYLIGSLIGNSAVSLRISKELNVFSAILIGLVALYLVLLTHELGHLLFGKLAGMRPFLLITGPLKLIATQNGWQVSLNTNISLAGGLAACMPVRTDTLRRDLLWLVAGGPITSLFGSILGFLLYALVPDGSPWSFFGLLFGATAGTIFLVTLVPAKTSGFMTDGAQILSLIRGGREVEQRALLLVLQAESLKGVRPRDYPTEILQRLQSLRCNPMMDASVDLFVYFHHLDCGDISKAGQLLDQVLVHEKDLPEGLKQAVYLEAAFFQAACRKQAQPARHFFERGGGALVEKHTLLRSEAAVLFAEGQHAEVRAKIAQTQPLFEHAFDVGGARAEKDWLDRYLN
jgi:hypothetical protein